MKNYALKAMLGCLVVLLAVMMPSTAFADGNASFPINFEATTNGTVTADKTNASLGETVTLTVTPAAGYELDTIYAAIVYQIQGGTEPARAPRKAPLFLNLGELTLTKVDDTHYTFTLPTEISGTLTPENIENVVVRVEPLFKELPVTGFPVSINQTANGTVTSDKARANLGETVTLTVTPSTGYQLDTLEAYIGYEITGTDDPARTPRKAPIYLNVMDLSLTKVDDTHYSFTLPSEINAELTPEDLSVIQVRVSAKFKANRIPGDVNEDGNLDIADLNILTNIVLGMTAAEEYPNADINGDGAVNTSDLNLLTTILLEKQ